MSTDTAATPVLSVILSRLGHMAEVIGNGYTADDVGPHLSCGEADSIANVLALVDVDAATTFLLGHASGDNEGEDHHGVCVQCEALLEVSWVSDDLPTYHTWTSDGTEGATTCADTGYGHATHDARPDDNNEVGDQCKECGAAVTWVGPSHNDWAHVGTV